MGSDGDCSDNAVYESFFATLGCELLDRSTWPTRAEAPMDVFTFIEGHQSAASAPPTLLNRGPVNESGSLSTEPGGSTVGRAGRVGQLTCRTSATRSIEGCYCFSAELLPGSSIRISAGNSPTWSPSGVMMISLPLHRKSSIAAHSLCSPPRELGFEEIA